VGLQEGRLRQRFHKLEWIVAVDFRLQLTAFDCCCHDFLLDEYAALCAIFEAGNTLVLGAMGATEKRAIVFDSVADNFTAAMGTCRRQCMNGAFEGIKDVFLAVHRDEKHFVIIVATHFTG